MASTEEPASEEALSPTSTFLDGDATDDDLPQCKIKRNYSCNLCPFFSQNPRSFLYHSRDVHFDKIKIYECSQCLYASKHSQKLQRHINMIHVPGRNPPKRVVTKKVTEKKQIKQPLMNMAATSQVQEEASGTTSEFKGKCSLCSFTSRSAALVTRHERVVHLKKKFLRCTKCSYVTHVKARFTKHVKYHSMPMIKCDLCDFRTPYKWNLDRHYKNHCGSGAFQCSKCNFRADIKQSLTVHEMNHHIPPVGAGAAILMRKKNKVGASETTALESDGIDQDELELLRLEREEEGDQLILGSDDEEPDLNADPPSKLETALNRSFTSDQESRTFGNPSFLHPSFAFKPIQCKFCNYKCTNNNELARHEKRNHGYVRDKRPPPNLIPIQGKSSSPILKIPEVRRSELEEPMPVMNEEEFKEMCKNSCLTSSLKEFVSLIGDEEALKTIPDPDEGQLNSAEEQQKHHTNYLKRKNSNFFDKIKEKLSQAGDEHLTCELCGHESKCLSESVAHDKRHAAERDGLVVCGTQLSSTRCQHCRQRCKTSADLVAHLKKCKAYEASLGSHFLEQSSSDNSMTEENKRVFVWNDFAQTEEEAYRDEDGYGDINLDSPVEFPSDLLETQLGSPEPQQSPAKSPRQIPTTIEQLPVRPNADLKKVFKCPHCSFWASTASRFHVHIVGHLNKKPFECSLCSYRSNWRWDITKHIRLKSARDPNHANATVNMTDETGRRNYSKYNKYLTMMKVHEPNADSSGSGRRTRACDVTQGTVREGDILQPMPEPPKLTPAPQPPTPTPKSSPQVTLRPPPLLQAAHTSSVCKRTLWKCKKCLYRNSDKEKVLTHVKSHYSKKTGLAKEDSKEDENCPRPNQGDHGNVLSSTEEDKDRSSDGPDMTPSLDLSQVIACDICPFTTETEGDLTAHKLNHVDRPGSIFKCTYCPFYVPSKIAVLEHMEVHGEKSDSLTKLKVDNFDPSERLDRSQQISKESKRFRCRQCPYLSNSKTQFLYHKQFHRPRNTQFKCMYCTYNVSRRHLLHQHLRVHHMYRRNDKDEQADIPLVWVLRGGSYLKMFKCRWCPHVNLRKINIQEHEKMHQETCKLQCPDCNYTCNNPGVLSSHVKVHSGFFGEIRSLVDPTKSDEVQIEHLQSTSTATEPEVVIKVEEPDLEPSTPESSYYQSNTVDEEVSNMEDCDTKTISFCNKCPARFFFKKELKIHAKFHLIKLPFKCSFCSYTARQRPHLLAHFKVHSQEYQERTAALVDTYMVHPENQQPKIAMVTGKSELIEGPVWSVIPPENLAKKPEIKPGKPQAKHLCNRCPAKFFKPVALQYHLTLHGGAHQHRCKYCDYTVKTYGNLIKHQLVHESTDNMAERVEILKKNVIKEERSPEKRTDPQFGVLMYGSPDFIYPTYFKNGKLKEKRYKCPKCPSAFEKRDQYKIHLSLHGSKQKYKCEKCDYSVKYYANYIQHVKKHQHNDDVRKAQKLEVKLEIKQEVQVQPIVPEWQPPPLTQIEKQTLLLMERKRKFPQEEERKMFFCELCPYTNPRRDCLESHERRHFILSGTRHSFNCKFCDYTTTQANFLREHSRVHFKKSHYQPEAYVLLTELELWSTIENEEESEQLLFKECEDGQFLPPFASNDDDDGEEEPKIFIDPLTGELIEEQNEEILDFGESHFDIQALLENPTEIEIEGEEDMIELVEEPAEEKPKIKRSRGKKWRCKKCPHAFCKRDQFLRHIALHGSNQKYSCGICDYSVKFYTNYVQHMRMHKSQEPHIQVEIKQYVAEPDSKNYETVDVSNAVSNSINILCDADVEYSSNESWASLFNVDVINGRS